MTFKEINPDVWTYEAEGDSIEGILVAKQSEVGPNKSMLYSIELKDAESKNVWGSAILDQRMNLVKVGSKVRITYQGLGEASTGKNAPKLFKVEVDSE